jgi:hypothetical protein
VCQRQNELSREANIHHNQKDWGGRTSSRIGFGVLRPSANTKRYAIPRIGLAYLNARANHQNPANIIHYFNLDTSANKNVAAKPDVNANKDTNLSTH